MRDAIARLAKHMQWADDRTLHSLRRAANVPPEALRVYSHVLGSEHTWLSRLRFAPPEVPVWPELDVTGCERLAHSNHDALQAFTSGLADADLDRPIGYTNTKGESFESRTSDILLHMSLHGSYHRGQVALLLRAADIDPLATDYIVHVRAP